jgi:hypothetical protein
MSKKDEDAIRALYDALAESVLGISEEDIVDEYLDAGESPDEVAERMRGVFRRTWKEFKQRPLKAARQNYIRAASSIQKAKPRLPNTAEERRKLLMGLLSRRPQPEQALTAQFRKFSEMADEDVESWLEQFADLGLIPSDDEAKE